MRERERESERDSKFLTSLTFKTNQSIDGRWSNRTNTRNIFFGHQENEKNVGGENFEPHFELLLSHLRVPESLLGQLSLSETRL